MVLPEGGRSRFLSDGRGRMRPNPECWACVFSWVYARVSSCVGERAISGLSEAIALAISTAPETSNLGIVINRAVRSAAAAVSGSSDHYRAFKERSNEIAAELLPRAQSYVEAGRTAQERMKRACALAAAANVAPLSAPSAAFTFREVIDVMEDRLLPVFTGDLQGTIGKARLALYVADNAGEIGFDSLVLQELKAGGVRVALAVKEKNFFEDAALADVGCFRLEQLVDEVLTTEGFFVPEEAEGRLQAVYRACDALIVKGTGSFEALRGETPGKNAVFMLKVKCAPISKETGVEQGKAAVMAEGDQRGAARRRKGGTGRGAPLSLSEKDERQREPKKGRHLWDGSCLKGM